MYSNFFKQRSFFFCLVIIITCFLSHASAQTNDDMNIFLMYYEETDLVVSSTRHLKPISQVAENIIVIHKKDIEKMNVHNVAEILEQITGLFIFFHTMDFGSLSIPEIQGSYGRHALVLLDGFPWNSLTAGYAETISIPVQIIERIEIIKGPASSAWGSSLGGIVNIITKSSGNTRIPEGTLKASYGEKNRQDLGADISGKAGPLGYYVYAGHKYSDPLLTPEPYSDNNVFLKLRLPILNNTNIRFSTGYNQPSFGLGDPILTLNSMLFGRSDSSNIGPLPFNPTIKGNIETYFATFELDMSLSENLVLNISCNQFTQKLDLPMSIPTTDYGMDIRFDEKSTRGNCKLIWKKGKHTTVMGMDYDHGSFDQIIRMSFYPENFDSYSDIDKWALYVNDTIVLNRLSLTPGIRFDHNDIGGSFTSPSIGITYKIFEDSVLRASVARGFTSAPLLFISENNLMKLFMEPNPSLKPEDVWAYRVGIETDKVKYVNIKTHLFKYDLNNSFNLSSNSENQELMMKNVSGTRCHGIEFETQTDPFYGVSLEAGIVYIDRKVLHVDTPTLRYAYNLGIQYDNGKSFNAKFSGHFIKWGSHYPQDSSNDDFIWNVNLNKMVMETEKISTKLFLKAHNIFNGIQYTLSNVRNPERWVEAGIRVSF